MPLTMEQRNEIRRRVQAPFRVMSRGRTVDSNLFPPDYDENDFTPDTRIVDELDPPVKSAEVPPPPPSPFVVGSMDRYMRRAKRGPEPQGAWCVELRRRFTLASIAAAFVRKSACSIYDAMKTGRKCGGYHWEYYDPKRHIEGSGNA